MGSYIIDSLPLLAVMTQSIAPSRVPAAQIVTFVHNIMLR